MSVTLAQWYNRIMIVYRYVFQIIFLLFWRDLAFGLLVVICIGHAFTLPGRSCRSLNGSRDSLINICFQQNVRSVLRSVFHIAANLRLGLSARVSSRDGPLEILVGTFLQKVCVTSVVGYGSRHFCRVDYCFCRTLLSIVAPALMVGTENPSTKFARKLWLFSPSDSPLFLS